MKFLKFSLLFLTIISSIQLTQAQTVDEIIDGYYEVIGGKDAWNALEGMKMTAKVNQGGMEIPLEIVQTKSGKSYTKVSFQGLDIMQGVFDGESLWSTNFQTMKPEKVPAEELENHMLTLNDFPDALINYKANKYAAELLGVETFDGTEAHKVKLMKEQKKVDGEMVDDVEFYFFEVDSGVLIGQESVIPSGPMKGSQGQVKFSDYDEVDGLFMPFTMSQGIKDGQMQALTIEKIELNPTIDEAMLAFPTATTEEEGK